MIGQPHKSPSISPKVLWPVLGIVILGLLIGGIFWLNSYIYNEKQGNNESTTMIQDQDDNNQNTNSTHNSWLAYDNTKYGYTIDYPQELLLENPVPDVVIFRIDDTDEYLQIQWFSNTPNETRSPNGAEQTGTVEIGGKTAKKYFTKNPIGEGATTDKPFTDYEVVLGNSEWIDIRYFAEEAVGQLFESMLGTIVFSKTQQANTSDAREGWKNLTANIMEQEIAFSLPISWRYNSQEVTGKAESKWYHVYTEYDGDSHPVRELRFAYYNNDDPTLLDWARKKQVEIDDRVYTASSELSTFINGHDITFVKINTQTIPQGSWDYDHYFFEYASMVYELAIGTNTSVTAVDEELASNIIDSVVPSS